MARKLRIQFPGAIYHIMNRGDRQEEIFRDDHDRESFLKALEDVCTKTSWQIHAYCLMPNHFHLVIETPQPNLVAGMKWICGTYTARFNRRHKLGGHVFAGRYKSLLIEDHGGYLRTVCDYVHLNPARAKLVAANEPLQSFKWSSYPQYIQPLTNQPARPAWLRIDRLFDECGFPPDTASGRESFAKRLEARREENEGDLAEEFKPIRRGWCLGSTQFRQSLLARIKADDSAQHFGTELHEAAEARADQIVDEELRHVLWTEAELRKRRKGDPAKVAIARRLRNETTVTLQWIASRLHMGTKTHLSHLLYWQRRMERDGKAPQKRTQRTSGNASLQHLTKRVARPNPPPHVPSEPAPEPVTRQLSIPLTDPFSFDPTFD